MKTEQNPFSVLILEDDCVGAKILKTHLNHTLPEIRVLHARSVEEAQSLLAEYLVDFFIIDVMLPDGSGLDFVADVQTVNPETRILLVSATFSKRLQQVRTEAGVQHVMPKPLDLRAIGALIGGYAEEAKEASAGTASPKPHDGFTARLQETGAFDVIQFRAIARATTMLEFATRDSQIGWIYLADGEITHAETAGITGMDALVEILSWQGGVVREMAGVAAAGRTIVGSTDVLLMHASQKIDERRSRTLRPSAGAGLI